MLNLHVMASDIGYSFFNFFLVTDMKTRKWSFSLEDYKRLSE